MDRTLAFALVAVLGLLLAGYVLLSVNGADTAGYVILLSGPIVSTIVGAVLTHRVAVVKAVVDDVHHQTNSILTTRLDSLDTQLSAAATDRTAHDHTTP